MEQFIDGQVFKYFFPKYVGNGDLYNLSEVVNNITSKNKIIEIIKSQTILEIEKRLLNELSYTLPFDKERYQIFLSLLKSTNSVISGSFLIQCMLETSWEGTDIDIFVPLKGNKISFTKHRNELSEIEEFLFTFMPFVDYTQAAHYGNDIDNKIRFMRTFKKNTASFYKIQVILVDIEASEIHDFILNNFDFDICKNIFSYSNENKGNNTNNGKQLYIHNLNDIMTKKTTFKVGNRLGSSIERCLRYELRGFSFVKEPIPLFRLEELINMETHIKLTCRPEDKFDCINNVNKVICKYSCPIKFCRPDIEHLHSEGEHIAHGRCIDLIYVDCRYFLN
jgi:hypothetical protein